MMTAFARTVILYFLLMLSIRLLGKRQLGELEPSELVLTMMLSDLATVPMQNFGLPLLSGIIPILALISLSMLLSHLSLKSLRIRELICGTPTVLIKEGKIQQEAMQKNRYTLDELLEELRQQGYSSISEVKYAILENSGHLSVLPWQSQKPLSASQLSLDVEDTVTLPVVLINDGRLLRRNLAACGRDEIWLKKELQRQKLPLQQVFLMTLDEKGCVTCVRKERTK